VSKPKISVCIPVHNAELWLAESIQSIADQTFKDWEIVCVNDNCSDSSIKIMKHFGKLLGDKFKRIEHLTNQGIGASRNEANAKASGEIICVQDADDISHKDRLQKTWDFFKRHSKVDLTYGTCQYIDMLGRPFHEVKSEPFDFDRIKKENYIQHPTVAYRRDVVLEVPYRKECKVIDDWFLYYDFHKAGKKIMPMQDTLAFYRVLKSSVSRSPEKAQEIEVMKKKFLEEANADTCIVGS
jgi:teichuronic acid biosynthesis glycosyltransferase TuaG